MHLGIDSVIDAQLAATLKDLADQRVAPLIKGGVLFHLARVQGEDNQRVAALCGAQKSAAQTTR